MQAIERAHPAAMRWTLDTPAYAHRNHHFYEKLGFQKAGEHDVDGFLLFAYEKRR
jgi:RimJ/RimL family protein N-acetyltransferase